MATRKLADLTHWGLDKMAANLPTTLSSALSWMKIYRLRLRFPWSMFPRVQLNGLAPARRQVIIWHNNCRFTYTYMRHSATVSQDLSESHKWDRLEYRNCALICEQYSCLSRKDTIVVNLTQCLNHKLTRVLHTNPGSSHGRSMSTLNIYEYCGSYTFYLTQLFWDVHMHLFRQQQLEITA